MLVVGGFGVRGGTLALSAVALAPEGLPCGGGEDGPSVGVEVHGPAAAVHDGVVVAAQAHEVADVGDAAVFVVDAVVHVAPDDAGVAAGEGAAAVAGAHGAALVVGGEADGVGRGRGGRPSCRRPTGSSPRRSTSTRVVPSARGTPSGSWMPRWGRRRGTTMVASTCGGFELSRSTPRAWRISSVNAKARNVAREGTSSSGQVWWSRTARRYSSSALVSMAWVTTSPLSPVSVAASEVSPSMVVRVGQPVGGGVFVGVVAAVLVPQARQRVDFGAPGFEPATLCQGQQHDLVVGDDVDDARVGGLDDDPGVIPADPPRRPTRRRRGGTSGAACTATRTRAFATGAGNTASRANQPAVFSPKSRSQIPRASSSANTAASSASSRVRCRSSRAARSTSSASPCAAGSKPASLDVRP